MDFFSIVSAIWAEEYECVCACGGKGEEGGLCEKLRTLVYNK